MAKIKILSKVYNNQKIAFGKNVIEFRDGVSEIDEDLYNEIQSSNFPGIYSEKKGGIPEEKNFTEKDADKIIKEAKELSDSEIDRLKNIIKAKDNEIKGLKKEINDWKKEVEKLKKPNKSESDSTKEKEDKEIVALKADLEKISFEELKSLAIEEGMEKEKVDEFVDETTKNDLIESLILFYKKDK